MGYVWRRLTPAQREEIVTWRKERERPWHSPPHRANYGRLNFLLSAACYEHAAHIGRSPCRMDRFSALLLDLVNRDADRVVAWCVLPNHYHVLVETPNILRLVYQLGRFHGRMSHAWNGEEGTRGRQVFHRACERAMRSERHLFASLNYVHHNPVRHGYVERWRDWPWSSALEYLDHTGREEAERIWRQFPIRSYGRKWDSAES